jgi:hypothetical protein
MSDCLGGYTFFNERFDGPNEKEIPGTNGKLFEWVPTTEPRYVNRGEVTKEVFGDSSAKILEINSKTGLYPLYVTYSLYRERCKDFVKAGLIEDVDNYSVEEEQVIWDDILANNVYVICNTPMAERITHRTLLGFRSLFKREGNEQVNIKSEKLIERALTDREGLIKSIKSVGYWRGTRNKAEMKFAAIVGNPPYQIVDGGGNGAAAVPVYNKFVDIARELSPSFISMIMPAKWYGGGRGLDEFRLSMLNETHIEYIKDYPNPKECFATVNISGGVCYFRWNSSYNSNKAQFVNVIEGKEYPSERELSEFIKYDLFPRYNEAKSIIHKVIKSKGFKPLSDIIAQYKPFGLRTFERGTEEMVNVTDVVLHTSRGIGYIPKSDITASLDYVEKYNVITGKALSGHLGETDENGQVKVLATTKVINQNEVCTESYIVLGKFDDKKEAINLYHYMTSKFLRFLLLQALPTLDIRKERFIFVPLQDFTSSSDIDWSKSVAEIDQQLYDKYDLSEEEREFIESMIKPME